MPYHGGVMLTFVKKEFLPLAANLGSMTTPIGNPQNLFLYSDFRMDLPDFLGTTLPYSAASLAGLLLSVAFARDGFLDVEYRTKPRIRDRRALVLHAFLLVACVLAVLRVVPLPVCLALVGVGVLAFNRGALRTLDYGLLVTFVAFFVFVGNLARVDAVRSAVSARWSPRSRA
jgi:Na+/H+ antiporter NhaD/arsenite permease-like protein